MTGRHPGRLAVMAGLPLVVLGFFLLAASHAGYTPDDTYIYLQYARNLVTGGGMSFNAGHPSYGFTSPLWVLIIAAGGRMGIDYAVAAQGIDLFFAGCAVALFMLVAYEMIREI